MVRQDPTRFGESAAFSLAYFDPKSLAALLAETADGAVHWSSLPNRAGGFSTVWVRALGDRERGIFGLALKPPESERDFEGLFKTSGLTPAEGRIIKALLKGESMAAVASASGVSRETIKTHLRNAYRKLSIRSRGELFAHARRFLAP